MSIQLVSQIWNLVSDSIPYNDRDQIAETFVGLLVEHGFDLAEIRQEFEWDQEIVQAVKYHSENDDSFSEAEYEDYDQYDDEDEEDW